MFLRNTFIRLVSDIASHIMEDGQAAKNYFWFGYTYVMILGTIWPQRNIFYDVYYAYVMQQLLESQF